MLKSCLMVVFSVMLASCIAQGQRAPNPVLPEIAGREHWKAFPNQSSHNATFFKDLLFGRVFVHEHSSASGKVNAEFVREDGRMFLCFWSKKRNDYALAWGILDVEAGSTGATRTVRHRGGVGRSLLFYDEESGGAYVETLVSNKNSHNRGWIKLRSGWVQDEWPRVSADACPDFVSLSGLGVNEKQTSGNLAAMLRQDPEAPIRRFPGSQHTGPGRTGLAASGGKPTTTREEVEAWLRAQEGNVLLSSPGDGYVVTEGWVANGEVWRLGDDGEVAGFGRIARKTDASGQEWAIAEVPDVGPIYYAFGYPLPLLSTGHRHAAWQLTDELIGSGKPVALPWMGKRYAGHRFLFHDKTLTIVAPGDRYLTGRWRWTKGRLQVTVDGEEAHARDIGWRELARELGVTPEIWTSSTPNRL